VARQKIPKKYIDKLPDSTAIYIPKDHGIMKEKFAGKNRSSLFINLNSAGCYRQHACRKSLLQLTV
jgi:hypothetical protein